MNHYRFTSIFILIVVLLVLLQCTAKEQSETNDAETALSAKEEIRIGQLEGENEYVFGAINQIAVGKDGAIFVSDRQVPIIRMYDKNGEFMRNVGREGSGPGEYLRIGGMRTFPDGRLAIWDARTMRITVFDEGGSPIQTHTVNSQLFADEVFEVDESENFYVKTVLRNTPDMPNWKLAWVIASSDGEIQDTLKIPFDEEEREQTFVLFTASGRAHAFIEVPFVTLSPKGHLVTGRNDTYEFELNLPDTTPKRIERDYTPVPVTPEEREQWRAWVSYYGTNNSVPEVKPPYKDIRTDMQGRIWVKRYVDAIYTEENIGPHFGPESNWWEPPVFDVFNPDGSFYAAVKLPMNASFREAKGRNVWAVIKGEFDEQYVARYWLEEESD